MRERPLEANEGRHWIDGVQACQLVEDTFHFISGALFGDWPVGTHLVVAEQCAEHGLHHPSRGFPAEKGGQTVESTKEIIEERDERLDAFGFLTQSFGLAFFAPLVGAGSPLPQTLLQSSKPYGPVAPAANDAGVATQSFPRSHRNGATAVADRCTGKEGKDVAPSQIGCGQFGERDGGVAKHGVAEISPVGSVP